MDNSIISLAFGAGQIDCMIELALPPRYDVGMPKSRTVSNLEDALLESANYAEASGFLVAPLNYRAGARSWHTLDSEAARWIKFVAEGQAPPVSLEFSLEKLPELPTSKIETWALAFVDEQNHILKPEVLIAPSEQSNIQAQGERAPANSPKKEWIHVMAESVKQANLDARLSAREAREAQSLAFQQLRTMLQEAQEELKDKNAQIVLLKQENEKILEARNELFVQLIQAQSGSGFYQTIQALFANKPELFAHGLNELVTGIVKAFKAEDTTIGDALTKSAKRLASKKPVAG